MEFKLLYKFLLIWVILFHRTIKVWVYVNSLYVVVKTITGVAEDSIYDSNNFLFVLCVNSSPKASSKKNCPCPYIYISQILNPFAARHLTYPSHAQKWTTKAWSLQDRVAQRTVQHVTVSLDSDTMLRLRFRHNLTQKGSLREKDCPSLYI